MTHTMNTHRTYKVGRDGVIVGVFDEPDMVYMISCGKVVGSDDYWTEGMSTWAKVSSKSTWTVSSLSIPPGLPPALPSTPRSSIPSRTAAPRQKTSFFSIWWKTTLVIYIACACLGYLNSGEYGLGYMLGQGLLSAPLSALFFGGIIYAFSKNTGPDRTKGSDHSEIVKQFDRSKILKK